MAANTSRKGRLISLCGSAIELVNKRSEAQVESLLEALQKFKSAPQELLLKQDSATSDIDTQLASWRRFYLTEFDLTCDFTSLAIPERREGFSRLVVVVPPLDHIFRRCRKHFPLWKHTRRELGNIRSILSERDPKNGPYAVWVQDADFIPEEYGYFDRTRIASINLSERLLLELKCLVETGKRFDNRVNNLERNQCAGSYRYLNLRDWSRAVLPTVFWGSLEGRLRVPWYSVLQDLISGSLRVVEFK